MQLIPDAEVLAARVATQAQISRAAEVQRRRSLVLAETEGSYPGLELRCEREHSGGKRPKVAEVHATPHGIFYVAKLPWARSDADALMPWKEETHLLSLFGENPALLDDDELLRNALAQLSWWREHGQGDMSWLADRGAKTHHVVEILNLPDSAGMLTLWSRCPLHLGDYEAVDPADLLQALR